MTVRQLPVPCLAGLILCLGVAVPAVAADDEETRGKILKALEAHRALCLLPSPSDPEIHRIQQDWPGGGGTSTYHLVRMGCGGGAYNTSDVWFSVDSGGYATPLSFASPHLDITYMDPGREERLKSIRISGYGAQVAISNSSYDPKTRTITSFHKWRGVADAFSGGTWRFFHGEMVLHSYEVDATYDGSSDPSTVFADGKPLL